MLKMAKVAVQKGRRLGVHLGLPGYVPFMKYAENRIASVLGALAAKVFTKMSWTIKRLSQLIKQQRAR